MSVWWAKALWTVYKWPISVTNSDWSNIISWLWMVCGNNSTSELLDANEIFQWNWMDVLEYAEIIVSISADVDSATDWLVVEWSSDWIAINETDEFSILANKGKTFTFPANRQYFRIEYTNWDTIQTTFDLQVIVKKVSSKGSSHRIQDNIVWHDDAILSKSVLSGEDPNGEFKNVWVQLSGSLNTSIQDWQTGKRAEIEPLWALKTVIPVRLVWTTFSNWTKDPNFWTETTTWTWTVTQAWQITMSTWTTANWTAKYETVRKARKITGTTNQFRCVAALTTDTQANNIRRIGAYDTNDWFFFQVNWTTLQVGSRKSTVDTLISSWSFNGNAWATEEAITNELYRFTIDYTATSAKFFVNGILLHKLDNNTDWFINSQNLKVTMENINSDGNTTDNKFVVQFATILRLWELVTNATYKYIWVNTTTVLKYNAWTLQKIINLDNAWTITIYDNTTATWTQIAVIDAIKVVGSIPVWAPFNNWLTVVTAGWAKVTVVYE